MKPLSQSLQELAERVKPLEDSASAAIESDKARLEKRRDELDQTLEEGRNDFEVALRAAEDEGREWWSGVKASISRPVDEIRTRHEQRHAEREVKHARRVAEQAEEDATSAIAMAAYWLRVAEYAVVDAALARLAADAVAEEGAGATTPSST